jgi:DNA-binding XRE family transcriptional regulator
MNPRNLRKMRLSLGLSPMVCANDMGVTRQTIHNLESGRTSKEASLRYYELYLQDVKRRRFQSSSRK